MELNNLFLLLFISISLNGGQLSYTPEECAAFKTASLAEEAIKENYEKTLRQQLQALSKNSLSFQSSILRASLRDVDAIKRELDIQRTLPALPTPPGITHSNSRILQLLNPGYIFCVKFMLAEFLLNNITSYTDYCRYLASEQHHTTVKILDKSYDISLPFQLRIFKQWYKESTSLKAKLPAEINRSNDEHHIQQMLITLQKYLATKDDYNAQKCINTVKIFNNSQASEATPSSSSASVENRQAPSYLDEEDDARLPRSPSIGDGGASYKNIFDGIAIGALPAPQSSSKTPKKTTFQKALPWAAGGIGTAAVCYVIYKNRDAAKDIVGSYLESGAHKVSNIFTRLWRNFHFGRR